MQLLISLLISGFIGNSFGDMHISINLDSDFPHNNITIFEKLENEFSVNNSSEVYTDSFGKISSYRSFLNSHIFRINQNLISMSDKDLDNYFRRQLAVLYLADIQWCLYLYLNCPVGSIDTINKYSTLYRIVSKLLVLTRTLKKVEQHDKDKVTYTWDGMVSGIDTSSITYDFERVTKIGSVKIAYSADKVVTIGSLRINYDSDRIESVGQKKKINKPALNKKYRNLSHFERKEFMERQKSLPGFIGLYTVLRLYLENKKKEGKTIPVKYFELYSIVKKAIAVSIEYKRAAQIGGKVVYYQFGQIESIGESHFDYFFNRIQSINGFKIEYFFGQISRAGDLRVKWTNKRITLIDDQNILTEF